MNLIPPPSGILSFLQSDKMHSFADSGLNSLFRLSAGILIARFGGAEIFAQYILLNVAHFTILGLIATFSDTPMLNLAPGLPQEKKTQLIAWSRNRSQRSKAYFAVIGVSLYPFIHQLNLDTTTYLGFVFATASAISSQFSRARLQALFQMKRALLADLPSVVIVFGCTLAGWHYLKDPGLGFWWGAALGFQMSAFLMDLKYPDTNPHSLEPSLQTQAIHSGRAMMLGSCANSACSRIHPYIIHGVTGATTVASYGAAWTFLGPLRMATVAFTNLLRPRLSTLRGKGEIPRLKAVVHQSILAIVIISALLGVLLATHGTQMVSFVFGADIEVPITLLIIAVAYAALDSITSIQMIQLQIQQDRGTRQASQYRIVAATISIILVFPCLSFFGLEGAFISLIIAEATYATLAFSALGKRVSAAKTAKVSAMSCKKVYSRHKATPC